jgi:hypothetical protein
MVVNGTVSKATKRQVLRIELAKEWEIEAGPFVRMLQAQFYRSYARIAGKYKDETTFFL